MKYRNQEIISYATNGRWIIGITDGGSIVRSHDGSDFEMYDFNAIYKGYYPDCRFSCISCLGRTFYAAGDGPDSLPLVFCTSEGDTWSQLDLIDYSSPKGMLRVDKHINAICCNKITKQIFLLCNDGVIVVLTGCPKCVKILHVSNLDITEGHFENEYLNIKLSDGVIKRVHLNTIMQSKISAILALFYIERGAKLIDLREAVNEEGRVSIPGSVNVPMYELPSYISKFSYDTFYIVFCNNGNMSGAAVQLLKSLGFINAYAVDIKELNIAINSI